MRFSISLKKINLKVFLPIKQLLSIFLILPASINAETIKTINNVNIDSLVLDIYIQNRTQQSSDQISADQRLLFLEELTDVYLLSTQEEANAIATDKNIQAQIELQNRMLIAQSVANNFFSKIEFTDEEILNFYNAMIESSPNKEYKASHILVESQSEAIDIIEQLNNGGDFSELAKEFSIGPSATNGGSLGNFFSPSQMVKPFSDAVEALDDGVFTTEPVQTEFGWHVILRETSRDAVSPTLESVKLDIEQQIRQTRFQGYINSLRDKLL